jgi:transglutaminase-like putative cysteine protease
VKRLLVVALAALLAGAAGLTWQRIVPLAALAPVLLTAAAVPAALVWLWSGRRGLSLWLAAPAALAAWIVTISATVLRPGAVGGVLPDATTLRAAVSGLTDSWSVVLTTILPAPAAPGLLAAVSALTFMTSWAAAEILTRGSVTAPALLPSLALLLTGLFLGVGGPGDTRLAVAGWLLVAALTLVLRSPRPAGRGLVAGVTLVAVITGVAVVAGPRLPVTASHPFDLRRFVVAPSQTQPALDPLDQISAWLAEPGQTLFRVGASTAQDWRIAELDQFDGQTWRSGDRFVPTGSRVPSPADTARNLQEQRVTIEALSGAWLPAADSAVSVTGTAVLADPATGVLLAHDGLHPGLSYAVVSAVRDLSVDQLRTAAPADDPAMLALPAGLPDAIADTARTATDGATFPAQQATRLESYLRQSAAYDPNAPPGHTYGHLAYFLGVSHRGTSEQFATAYAVMARSIGLPARVAVGFRAGTPQAAGFVVHGADALAWPEVEFQGLGWVPFYPTPDESTSLTAAGAAGGSGARQRIDDSIDTAPITVRAQSTKTQTSSPVRAQRPLWTVAVDAGAALVIGYLATVMLVPVLRRRRRRRGGPADQVAGAWAQLRESLRRVGLDRLDALTAAEVARVAGDRLGPPARAHLSALARLADVAAFSDHPLDPRAGRHAWQHWRATAAIVGRRLGPLRRLRTRLAPTVLRRHDAR